MSIHNNKINIKGMYIETLVYLIVLILMTFSGYGMGLLVNFNNPADINITKNCQVLDSIENNQNKIKDGYFWASKSGSVYYPAWCKAGERVKEGNRLYFDSKEDAQNAGFSLSKQCKL